MTTRILNDVLLLVLGVVLGAVGTVAHQSTLDVAGASLPGGITLALLAYTSLLAGLRVLSASRVPALVVALGALVTIFVFSLRGPGGSVLIPNNLLGQVWVVAPVVIGAILIAWPRIHHDVTKQGDQQSVIN